MQSMKCQVSCLKSPPGLVLSSPAEAPGEAGAGRLHTSMYWPTQKACMDSLVSSNCSAASNATTGSSVANWAASRTEKHA